MPFTLYLALGPAAISATARDWVEDPTHALLAFALLVAALKVAASCCYYRDLDSGRERRRQHDDIRLDRRPR